MDDGNDKDCAPMVCGELIISFTRFGGDKHAGYRRFFLDDAGPTLLFLLHLAARNGIGSDHACLLLIDPTKPTLQEIQPNSQSIVFFASSSTYRQPFTIDTVDLKLINYLQTKLND